MVRDTPFFFWDYILNGHNGSDTVLFKEISCHTLTYALDNIMQKNLQLCIIFME